MSLTVREAMLSFRRAPALSALAITTIGFALFVLGLFALVALNLERALTAVEERVEIVLYVIRGTPIEAVTTAIGDIQVFPEVDAVTYVPQEEALERARRELSEFQGIFQELETNPLPASLEVSIKDGFRSAEHLAAVAERLRGFRFTEDVRYGRDWVEKLGDLRTMAGVVGFIVGLAFLAAATIIIGTTIRMTVLARQREIQIMRLVGATDGFVRRPFLLDGAIKGALGGILAVTLTYAAYASASETLFQASFFTADQITLFVVFGALAGFTASAASVGRHLSQV